MQTICSKQHLTAGFIKSLKAETDLQITDAAVPGLSLRYSATMGRKIYYFWYRVKGTLQQRNMRLGSSDEFSLVEIRGRAVELKKDVSNALTRKLLNGNARGQWKKRKRDGRR